MEYQQFLNVEQNVTPELLLIPEDITVEIFLNLGAIETANCAMVCRRWNKISNDSRSLWEHFTTNDFRGLQLNVYSDRNDNYVEWGGIYRYIIRELIDPSNIVSLQARVIFADDGSAYLGYPPENAFDKWKSAWCTNAGVDKNVDLVAELPTTCIVTGFCAENGGTDYSAPLKEALVFASIEKPSDLCMRQKFNDTEGSKWVMELVHRRSLDVIFENSRKKIFGEDCWCERKRFKKSTGCSTSEQQQHPIAAFQFPSDYYSCINTKIEYCCAPTIARYIHFKLLSSVHPADRYSTNIDILNLSILGVNLPCLPEMLKSTMTSQNKQPTPDPSYKRLHKLRPNNYFMDMIPLFP